MSYESKPLRDLCKRIQQCTLGFAGCRGWVEHGCDPCHSNSAVHGKGGAMKAHDFYVAAGCNHCHTILDQGREPSQGVKEFHWARAHARTMAIFFENRWLVVR